MTEICEELRKQLIKERAELLSQLADRRQLAIERLADPTDATVSAVEREWSSNSVERESVILRRVDGALQRLENGSFGTVLNVTRKST